MEKGVFTVEMADIATGNDYRVKNEDIRQRDSLPHNAPQQPVANPP